jgi:hypothetical protein
MSTWNREYIVMYGKCPRLYLGLLGENVYVEKHSAECRKATGASSGWTLSHTPLGFRSEPLVKGSATEEEAMQAASKKVAQRLCDLTNEFTKPPIKSTKWLAQEATQHDNPNSMIPGPAPRAS